MLKIIIYLDKACYGPQSRDQGFTGCDRLDTSPFYRGQNYAESSFPMLILKYATFSYHLVSSS